MANIAETPRPFGSGLTEETYRSVLHALENETVLLPSLLAPLHPADIADLLERLPIHQRQKVFENIPPEAVPTTLAEVDDGVQAHLLQQVDNAKLAEYFEELDSDDVADIVQHLDEERVSDAVKQLEKKEKRLVKYNENTAGGMMDIDYVAVLKTRSIAQVIDYLREEGDELPDDISHIFVTTKEGVLEGSISVSRLVRLPPNKKIAEVMRRDPLSVYSSTPQEEVARLFEKYDLHSCPVISKKGKLIGRITVDDVLDFVAKDAARDFMQQAGLDEGDDLFAPVSQTTRARFPWLLINLLTAILASSVIALFEKQIAQLVVLAVLMPIVASMGGNAASQTLTVTVRGLATRKITFNNAFTLLQKELLVGSLNGLMLGVLLAVGVVVLYGDVKLGAVIFVATVANHLFAAIAGNLVPLLLEKFKRDPAISSGVLVTTVTDVGGFFVFLGLAALLLL